MIKQVYRVGEKVFETYEEAIRYMVNTDMSESVEGAYSGDKIDVRIADLREQGGLIGIGIESKCDDIDENIFLNTTQAKMLIKNLEMLVSQVERYQDIRNKSGGDDK